MIGYIGIGFLTLGKAAQPLLPESFTLFGETFRITLMGIVIVIAIITGIYITFGGQTAVIFTDLLQGFILLFAGFLLFFSVLEINALIYINLKETYQIFKKNLDLLFSAVITVINEVTLA